MAKFIRTRVQLKSFSSLAQADALAKLLIEKGIITQQEFLEKIAVERATKNLCKCNGVQLNLLGFRQFAFAAVGSFNN